MCRFWLRGCRQAQWFRRIDTFASTLRTGENIGSVLHLFVRGGAWQRPYTTTLLVTSLADGDVRYMVTQ